MKTQKLSIKARGLKPLNDLKPKKDVKGGRQMPFGPPAL
jgi:hypothetical protein